MSHAALPGELPVLPKKPHTAIIFGKTNSGKTYLMLDLIEKNYDDYFEKIVIICPTCNMNKTYQAEDREWLKKCTIVRDAHKLIPTLDKLLTLTEQGIMKGETLVIIDDCASERDLEKHRTALSKIAFHGRHHHITTWFLTQKYTSVPLDFRDNVGWVIVTKCVSRKCIRNISEENDYIQESDLRAALNNKQRILLNIDEAQYVIF